MYELLVAELVFIGGMLLCIYEHGIGLGVIQTKSHRPKSGSLETYFLTSLEAPSEIKVLAELVSPEAVGEDVFQVSLSGL